MATTLHFRIVTPDGEIFKADAEYVSLPGSEGELGIYPNHIPLVTATQAGTVMARVNGQEHHFAVGRGAAELAGDHVSLIADGAIDEDNIDAAAAEAAIKRAEEAMQDKLSGEEVATLEASIARASAQIKLKRRRP
jgi:F-type H+-transporting ATPase subunit epsilon